MSKTLSGLEKWYDNSVNKFGLFTILHEKTPKSDYKFLRELYYVKSLEELKRSLEEYESATNCIDKNK